MSDPCTRARRSTESGYSLIELMVTVAVLTVLSATVMSNVLRLTKVTDTMSNRAEMHSGVRNAAEFLQQELGQAGRIGLPNAKTLGSAVGGPGAFTVTVLPDTTGLFVGEQIVVGTGAAQETVRVTAMDGTTVTTTFDTVAGYAANEPITAQGGFGAGIVPPGGNGSDGYHLKLYGDFRGDGQMQYIEYWCDTAGGNLYRRAMDITAVVRPAWNVSKILLNNITQNPGNPVPPCFTYDARTVVGNTYIVNVARTLLVLTQDRDPITGLFQRETKALLNVSPQNVFNVWLLASQDMNSRVRPMPQSVTTLLTAPEAAEYY